MKSLSFIAVAILAAGTLADAQGPVYSGTVVCGDGSLAYGSEQQAEATCVERLCKSGWAQAHGAGSECGSSGSLGADRNAAIQGAMNQLGVTIDEAIGMELHKMIFGDPAAKAAAEAAAAEAQQEQQAAIARQQALEEQRREAIFNRLSHELMGLSDAPQLQMMGMSDSPQLQMMGMEDAPKLGMMGVDGASSASSGTAAVDASSRGGEATGGNTCFFGECSPQNPDLSEPIEAWNDPKVVDLRDLQQGVDLANVATKAPPADRQTIMDQALAAANGDQSIQATIPAGTTVPVMSEQGLLAFQQANNAYRQAHDSAYQLQKSFQLNQQREAAVNAVVTQSEKELESDLSANVDQMTLEQKQIGMAQIFDAARQQELAYGKTWAQYLAARQKFYQDQYDLQMYLWKVALNGKGNPPPVPPQLSRPAQAPTAQDAAYLEQIQVPPATPAATVPGPPDSDLSLVLPLDPTPSPTASDLKFLEQIELQPPDSITQKVIASFRQDESSLTSTQAAFSFPPNLINLYDRSPQFQRQVNVQSKAIYAQQQQTNQKALHDAEAAWKQELSDVQSKGLYHPDIPLEQQVQTNPQLAAQLAAEQKQITAQLDYKVTRAAYQAQQRWQKWIERQEAGFKSPTITSVAAARD